MGDGSPNRPADQPTDRRGFFRQSLASIVGPLADFVEGRLEQVRRSMGLPAGPPPDRRLLRPPGALPEAQFVATCQSCGKCASVCPVQAIYLVRERSDEAGKADAVRPVICPGDQPCTLCDSLACMQECPSGALVRTARERIRMGLAEVNARQCLRSRGQDCQLCLGACPVADKAIFLATADTSDGPAGLPAVRVEPSGCIGCGQCEFHCPSTPRAIRVAARR